ncbi:hypothetical protein [Tenacibaculum sp. 190524A05c]|uniref:hypothetical protein n=1 Tax=Tenacibaculum platacis TaxID=3137852 RepID=UPI0032B226E6
MKKSILSFGKAINRKDQKNIFGGGDPKIVDGVLTVETPFVRLGPGAPGLPDGGGDSNLTCSSMPQNTCISTPGCVWYGCYCETSAPHIAPC